MGAEFLHNGEFRVSSTGEQPLCPRLADELITELLAEFPALLLVGPRASGKTTTAVRHARTVIRLDEPREAAVVEAIRTPHCATVRSRC
ncbi:MAG: hypothetical protein ACRDRP_15260 [Pseudonocardiaceae bacterium]